MRFGATLGLMLLAQAAQAEPPALSLPLDCALGVDCYIEDYVDANAEDGQTDYTCGLKSRDGHRGTDIMLESFAALDAGVHVLAAAPGIVAATRDGMEDIAVTDETRDAIEGQECGNGVRIDHGAGWNTLYCHLRKGSILVQQGERVETGNQLGLVGLSGLTNVPHVHFSVLKDGQMVDPFAPDDTYTCEAPDDKGLWIDPPPYVRTGLFTAGFSTGVPSFADVQSGAARVLNSTTSDPLVLYGFAFYAEPGDTMLFSAVGPDGEVFTHTEILDDPRLRLFRAHGRRAPSEGWAEGEYRGVVRLERAGELIAWRHAEISVTSQ